MGDSVVYSKFAGTEFSEDGEDYLILAERDILAKLAGSSAGAAKSKTK